MKMIRDNKLVAVSEGQFRIKYVSEDETYHEMDAAHLAEALQGLSQMGRAAYRVMYPTDSHSLHVRVVALEAGSFDVVLEAMVPALEHLYGTMVSIFSRTDAQAASAAITIGTTIAGAIGVKRRLQRPPKEVSHDGDQTTIVEVNGDETTVPTVIYNIAGDATFTTGAAMAVAPLQDPNYQSMSIRDSSGTELNAVSAAEAERLLESVTVPLSDDVVRIEAKVETVHLSASNTRKWSFSSAGKKFNADMEDHDFAERVATKEVTLGARTMLSMDRREVITSEGGAVKRTYSIVKVHRTYEDDEDATTLDVFS